MSEITTPNALKSAYPYQFRGETRYAFEWYRGWFAIAAKLCADVDALVRADRFHRRFRWLQIKEKWGGGRFYWEMRGLKRALVVDVISPAGEVLTFEPVPPGGPGGDRIAARKIRELVKAAQEATHRTCIVCGAAGTARQGGWILTLCDEHARLRELQKLPDFGFSAAEGGIDPL